MNEAGYFTSGLWPGAALAAAAAAAAAGAVAAQCHSLHVVYSLAHSVKGSKCSANSGSDTGLGHA